MISTAMALMIWQWGRDIFVSIATVMAESISILGAPIQIPYLSWPLQDIVISTTWGRPRGSNYDGNHLGNVLALVSDSYYGTTMSIYLGSHNPDTTTDWSYDPGHNLSATPGKFFGGHDITGDGCDDFGWRLANNIFYIFLGGSPLPSGPADSTDLDYPWFSGDVSSDTVEDIIFWSSQGRELCLGGNPFDLIPDYRLGYNIGGPLFTYNLQNGVRKLAGFYRDSLFLYNPGLPFDSIPSDRYCVAINYLAAEVNMGDLTGDGVNEIALTDAGTATVRIYSLLETSVVERDEQNKTTFNVLSCYPNPFNDAAIILINSAAGIKANFEIGIYDITGQLIRQLQAQNTLGLTAAKWDATDAEGHKVSSGVYFARLINGKSHRMLKMLYLK